MVTETPKIYKDHIHPYMRKKRDEGRLNWVFNIIEGRTEQEDVLLRDKGAGEHPDDAFLVLPDLNWDRKTLTSLHLLALVERRDIWSLRDLQKSHVPWLKHVREKILDAATSLYEGVERDQLKLYVHCTVSGPIASIFAMTDILQINPRTTTSTSTSCTSSSKPASPNPWVKHSASKTSSHSSRPWPVIPMLVWQI